MLESLRRHCSDHLLTTMPIPKQTPHPITSFAAENRDDDNADDTTCHETRDNGQFSRNGNEESSFALK